MDYSDPGAETGGAAPPIERLHPMDDDRLVRLSINLSHEVADSVKEYARRKGISITEAVRRAIGILRYVDDAHDRGATFNVEEGGVVKEVVILA